MRRRVAPRLLAVLVIPVVLALAVVACGDDGGGDTSGGSGSRPAGATDIVASRRFQGGFVPVGSDEVSLPDVVVYGDGLALAPTQDGRVLQAHLTEAEVDALVNDLLDTGLADLPARVEPEGGAVVMDAPDTVITVAVGDEQHEVAANALDFEELGYPAGLRQASTMLTALGDRVRAEGEPWTSERIKVVATGPAGEGDSLTWPAAVEVPADLLVGTVSTTSSTTMDGADAEAVAAVLGTQHFFQQVELPDGTVVSLAWRPLLPHE
jgi:hypothetical protein